MVPAASPRTDGRPAWPDRVRSTCSAAQREYGVWDGQHVDLADELVVNASTVSLVDVRPRQVPVDIMIPSVLPDEEFTVRHDVPVPRERAGGRGRGGPDRPRRAAGQPPRQR